MGKRVTEEELRQLALNISSIGHQVTGSQLDMEIGRMFGMSQPTISNYKKRLIQFGHIKQINKNIYQTREESL